MSTCEQTHLKHQAVEGKINLATDYATYSGYSRSAKLVATGTRECFIITAAGTNFTAHTHTTREAAVALAAKVAKTYTNKKRMPRDKRYLKVEVTLKPVTGE